MIKNPVVSFWIKLIGIVPCWALALTSCGDSKSGGVANGINQRVSATFQGPALPDYCLGSTAYSNTISISGNASFQYRAISTSLGSEGLGPVESTPLPIRHAEFVVTNSLGQQVQCGETDGDGNFSFVVPLANSLYSLEIRSRAQNSFNRVNVLKAPETNELFTLDFNFSGNLNRSGVNLVASATSGDLPGGAFHILDQIENTRTRIAQLTAGLDCVANDCISANAIPSVDIFWEAGFNPGSYIQGNPATSFFNREANRVFILGGLNGDVNFSDTDHYDPAIIIHEYFHFLENNVSQTNSPGGAHNGNEIIDPRLAWSEGAAQFFQGAILDIPSVLDTRGNADGDTGFFLSFSLETRTNDIPLEAGEGEFREFSVSRVLWDAFDDQNDLPFDNGVSNSSDNTFLEFWKAFTGNSTGFRNPAAAFRSSGLIHQQMDINSGGLSTGWQNILAQDFHSGRNSGEAYRGQYGRRISTCGSPTALSMNQDFLCNFNFTGAGPCVIPTSLFLHHPSTNSDFYYINHAGGTLNLNLRQTSTTISSGSGGKGDLDLFIYGTNHIIGNGPDVIAQSNTANVNNSDLNADETESINVNLATGTYLIQVFVRDFSSNTDTINYQFDGFCAEVP